MKRFYFYWISLAIAIIYICYGCYSIGKLEKENQVLRLIKEEMRIMDMAISKNPELTRAYYLNGRLHAVYNLAKELERVTNSKTE